MADTPKTKSGDKPGRILTNKVTKEKYPVSDEEYQKIMGNPDIAPKFSADKPTPTPPAVAAAREGDKGSSTGSSTNV